MRVALAQINTTVGDIWGNVEKMADALERATDSGAELVAYPELTIPGYPPEDLLMRPSFIEENVRALDEFAGQVPEDVVAAVGFVDLDADLYNACAVISGGEVLHRYHKHYLPNYGVFDENRYFREGSGAPILDLDGALVGVSVCEDIWYPGGPAREQALGGASVLLNISASPYHRRKGAFRERMLGVRASDYGCYVVFCNLVGGQDELVFDGHSVVFDPEGASWRGPASSGKTCCSWTCTRTSRSCSASTTPGPARRTTEHAPEMVKVPAHEPAAVEPVETTGSSLPFRRRARCSKPSCWASGTTSARTGSRGPCSVSRAASTPLWPPPSPSRPSVPRTSPASSCRAATPRKLSNTDAAALAKNLGIDTQTVPIGPAFDAYREMMEEAFKGLPEDVTEENLQSRIRGNILMALSNKFGWIVLSTGNKSEMSVGYSTLYGDSAGGFAVIKDVPKNLVYRVARHFNERKNREVIPDSVLNKEPTAELREDQRDTDSLPPYEVLDPILEAYIEEDMGCSPDRGLGLRRGRRAGASCNWWTGPSTNAARPRRA